LAVGLRELDPLGRPDGAGDPSLLPDHRPVRVEVGLGVVRDELDNGRAWACPRTNEFAKLMVHAECMYPT
jgi:hypothetical protein